MKLSLQQVTCLVAITLLPLGHTMAQNREAARTIRKANKMAKRGHKVEATNLYWQAVREQPEDAAANFALGSFLLENRINLDAAQQYLGKAYELKPDLHPQLAYRYAQAQHLNRHYAEAIPLYQASMQTLRNTVSLDDALEYEDNDLTLSAEQQFSASDLIQRCRKQITECESALAMMTQAAPIVAGVSSLGAGINSPYSDHSPVLSDSGRMIFFASRRPKNGDNVKHLPHEDIYYATRDEDGHWSEPKALASLNTKQHEAPLGLSPDGKEMYLYRDVNGGDILVSSKGKGNSWSKPKSVSNKINSNFFEPSFGISPNGKFGFFSSNRPDGFGGLDIYVTMRQPDGSWSEAFNLGPTINTEFDEDAPFVLDDNTLYFSSKGHNSIGGFDLFRTTSEGALWATPVNLGTDVNSPFDDIYLSLADNGQEGVFASNRYGNGLGKKDLYAVRFGAAARPDTLESEPQNVVALVGNEKLSRSGIKEATGEESAANLVQLTGRVVDAVSAKPVAATVQITRRDDSPAAKTEASASSGDFSILLPNDGSSYTIEVRQPGYAFATRRLDIAKGLNAAISLEDFTLTPLATGKAIVLKNMYFNTNEAIINPKSMPELRSVVQMMQQNPDIKVEIGGHTDNVGAADYNQTLSEQRAKAVVAYLETQGIAPHRLKAVGYGMRSPIASNGSDSGRQENRRTELKVLATH